MKNILAAVILSIATISSASANQDVCKKAAELGMLIMEMRQSGTPITKMLDFAAGSPSDEETKKLTNTLINKAYQKTRYSHKPNQESAAVDFGTEIYTACMRSRM
jgi:hypothetical protein